MHSPLPDGPLELSPRWSPGAVCSVRGAKGSSPFTTGGYLTTVASADCALPTVPPLFHGCGGGGDVEEAGTR